MFPKQDETLVGIHGGSKYNIAYILHPESLFKIKKIRLIKIIQIIQYH